MPLRPNELVKGEIGEAARPPAFLDSPAYFFFGHAVCVWGEGHTCTCGQCTREVQIKCEPLSVGKNTEAGTQTSPSLLS